MKIFKKIFGSIDTNAKSDQETNVKRKSSFTYVFNVMINPRRDTEPCSSNETPLLIEIIRRDADGDKYLRNMCPCLPGKVSFSIQQAVAVVHHEMVDEHLCDELNEVFDIIVREIKYAWTKTKAFSVRPPLQALLYSLDAAVINIEPYGKPKKFESLKVLELNISNPRYFSR